MLSDEKLQSRPLTEQVGSRIMNYIRESKMEIGSRIPNEFELAEAFGVGRSTVREAIKMLVSKRVLEVRRGSGTYIINTELVENDPLGLGSIADRNKLALDLIAVRMILEPEIAAMAAENATSEDINNLKSQCAVVEHMILQGLNHTSEDVKLHTMIAKCSKNEVIENLVSVIDSAVVVFSNITHQKLREETIRTHRDVVDAISRHDSMGAKCAMMMHMTYNRQMIMKIIEETENNQ